MDAQKPCLTAPPVPQHLLRSPKSHKHVVIGLLNARQSQTLLQDFLLTSVQAILCCCSGVGGSLHNPVINSFAFACVIASDKAGIALAGIGVAVVVLIGGAPAALDSSVDVTYLYTVVRALLHTFSLVN